jgi:hypothetical protein
MIVTLDSSTPAQQMAAQATAKASGASAAFSEQLGQATSDASATASAAAAPLSGLRVLFPGTPADWVVTPDAAPSNVPTMESVFGAQPFLDNPIETLPDGSSYNLNPIWFATPATAAKAAAMLGGTVVECDEFTAPTSIVQQQQPNQMVQLPNGTLINPGQVAWLFNHGYQQSYIDARMNDMVTGIDTE